MSVLTLGSTMGILTWIFVDGHFATWLNFTPTPLTAPVIGLIIALIFGLSTDYEVFLVSRMVEARERGMSTQEAIRIGTATTGRIITAAALIVAVVAGAFVFSDLVMMKYLAFGLMAALLLDATIVRMFLVPSVMKLLGDDCWWAPRWMRRLQTKIGLGEINLPDERKRPSVNGRPARPPVEASLVAVAAAPTPSPQLAHDPTHPDAAEAREPGRPRPVTPETRPARGCAVRGEHDPYSDQAVGGTCAAGGSSATDGSQDGSLLNAGQADHTRPRTPRQLRATRPRASPVGRAPPTASGPTVPPSAGETRAFPVSKPVSTPVSKRSRPTRNTRTTRPTRLPPSR